jgi:Transposase DDE domain group 1
LEKARRVVAKVELHTGELFSRVGFIVTNLETNSRAVLRFYNKRGTAEQRIKEGRQGREDDSTILPSVPLE